MKYPISLKELIHEEQWLWDAMKPETDCEKISFVFTFLRSKSPHIGCIMELITS